jgi:hypothetical protein
MGKGVTSQHVYPALGTHTHTHTHTHIPGEFRLVLLTLLDFYVCHPHCVCN